MSVTTGLFYLFSAILLVSAFRVITARNPVHAVLFLVLAFVQASMLWMLLKAEFLSIALVLVYVGAVMVLFLFVVMMIDVNVEGLREGFWNHFPLAAVIGVVIALEMSAVLMGGFRMSEDLSGKAVNVAGAVQMSNTKEIGLLMYNHYVYPLEVATAILLVGMIAAIALTLRTRKNTKYVQPGSQVRIKAKDRMTVLKMAPTRPAVEPVEAAPNGETKV